MKRRPTSVQGPNCLMTNSNNGLSVGFTSTTFEDQTKRAQVNTQTIERLLNLKGDVRAEMKKIEQLEFDIFKV